MTLLKKIITLFISPRYMNNPSRKNLKIFLRMTGRAPSEK